MCLTGKLVRWPVAVACLLLLAACAHEPGPTRPSPGAPSPSSALAYQPATPQSQSRSAPAAAPAPGHGRIRGVAVRPPGRDPRSGHGGDTVPVSGDPVHAYDSDGHVVASTVSARDGRFEFSVPPGTYRVAEDICGVAQQVHVTSGATVTVTLTVPNAC
jgi:hypothetical protein